MSAPYTVAWGDLAGEIDSVRRDTFDEALEVYRERNRMAGVIAFMSGDGAEQDGDRWHDGLTEEERDQL